VAKGLKVTCLFMIAEVSIRCQKNPEVGIRRIPAYTPPPIHHWPYGTVISHAPLNTIDELGEDSDDRLFVSARYNPNHVLHRLLPQPKTIEHNLRQRTHNLTLPTDVNATMKQNCVYRMLFGDIH